MSIDSLETGFYASLSAAERVRLALDAGAVAGTWFWDVQADRFTADERFARSFGLDSKGLEGGLPLEQVVQVIHPEDEPRVRYLINKALTEGSAYRCEYRVRQPDGHYRWIEANGRVDVDRQGVPLSFPGVLIDIDHRKRTELHQRTLLELGDQLRDLESEREIGIAAARVCAQTIDAPRCGYGSIGTLGTHVRIAADWCQDESLSSIAGNYRFADFGSFIVNLIAGEVVAIDDVHRDGRTADQISAFEQLKIRAFLNVPLKRDGRLAGVFLVHDSVPRQWTKDEIVFVRGVADRTWAAIATAQALGELRSLNSGLEREVQARTIDRNRLWQLSRDVLLVAEFSGEIVAANPAWETTLGWNERELVGRSLMDLVHPDDLEHTAHGAKAIAAGTSYPTFENRYRHKNGSYRWISWSAGPADSLIIASGRDITENKEQEASLRQAEEQLRQSQKMEAVGQLTGGIAHDFNNLLTIISSSVQLMQRPNLIEERKARFLVSISNAVARAAKLTGQLLAFARRQTLQPVVFDARQNIAVIADMIQTLVGSRVVLQIDCGNDACFIDADPGQFDTAIVNMAANARDAMDGVGTLTISIRRVKSLPALRGHSAISGAFVAVSVTDTGSGIAADRMEKVFEPFYTTKPVGHGTGLGLSQVFGFAKQSGGDIQVESQLGSCTTFTVFLPIATRLEGHAPGEITQAEDASRGGHILVVEDNHDVAAVTQDTLTELGYEVTLVHSSADALAEVAEKPERFGAMFSDVMMAGMDGFGLAKEVRRLCPGLPILLSSGYNEVLARSEGYGFPLLPKPYDLEALDQALRTAIRIKQAPIIGNGTSYANPKEQERLKDLASLRVMDSSEEESYNDIAQLAASMFGVPMALISLVDGERQWFKARVGIQLKETAREHAFCAKAIEAPAEVMVISDAGLHPDFKNNPLVTDGHQIRFYAGAPLVTVNGHAIGTVCVLDVQPRVADKRHLEALKLLSKQVMERLERNRRRLPSE